jgi:hypothetical protein
VSLILSVGSLSLSLSLSSPLSLVVSLSLSQVQEEEGNKNKGRKAGRKGARVCVLVAQNLQETGACLKGANTRENSETRLGISLTRIFFF